jgi:hypothetical protein
MVMVVFAVLLALVFVKHTEHTPGHLTRRIFAGLLGYG